MTEDKKLLIQEQINKIAEVIENLGQHFADTTEDEINFLNVVKKNLEELVK